MYRFFRRSTDVLPSGFRKYFSYIPRHHRDVGWLVSEISVLEGIFPGWSKVGFYRIGGIWSIIGRKMLPNYMWQTYFSSFWKKIIICIIALRQTNRTVLENIGDNLVGKYIFCILVVLFENTGCEKYFQIYLDDWKICLYICNRFWRKVLW